MLILDPRTHLPVKLFPIEPTIVTHQPSSSVGTNRCRTVSRRYPHQMSSITPKAKSTQNRKTSTDFRHFACLDVPPDRISPSRHSVF